MYMYERTPSLLAAYVLEINLQKYSASIRWLPTNVPMMPCVWR